MHEMMVAQSILSTIREEAAKVGAKPIGAKVSCGQLNPINDEALKFAFEAAARGTECEGMKIKVVHIPLKSICKNCGNESDFDVYSPGCGKCRSTDFSIGSDAPLMLEQIELQDSSDNENNTE